MKLNLTPFVVVATLVLGSCMSFNPSDEAIEEELAESGVTVSVSYLESGNRALRYMTAGNPDGPRVLFVHGAPGSMDAFNSYFQDEALLAAAELVSVDRPGYGGSGHGETMWELDEQADLICELVEPGTIIVGHSIGGTIAMRLAMEHPDLTAGLVLVAASLSSEDEQPLFFNRMMERGVFNWMMTKPWRVANAERFYLKENLLAMEDLWDNVKVPVALIHGTRDRIVPIEHSLHARERLPSETTTLDVIEKERHFLLWTQEEIVTTRVMDLL